MSMYDFNNKKLIKLKKSGFPTQKKWSKSMWKRKPAAHWTLMKENAEIVINAIVLVIGDKSTFPE